MTRQYLRWRLAWYLRTSAGTILRYWQWLVLACLIVPGPPVVAPLLQVASFLRGFTSTDLGPVQRLIDALAFQTAAVLWAIPQREAISGGPFTLYARTLPVPRGVRLFATATVLTVANSAILASAALATVDRTPQITEPTALCCLWGLMGLAMVAQHAVLTGRPVALVGVGLADVALAGAQAVPQPVLQTLLLLATIGGALLGLRWSSSARGAAWPARVRLGFSTGGAGIRFLSRRAPALVLQGKVLAQRPTQTGLRLIAVITLALGTDRLMAIFEFDARAAPTAVLAMAAMSIVLAGFYRTLNEARRPMKTFLAALPLPPRYWALRDTTVVLLLSGIPTLMLVWPGIAHGLPFLLAMLCCAAAFQVLLVVVRWPVVHSGRRSLLYCVLLAALWSSAAIAAVSR